MVKFIQSDGNDLIETKVLNLCRENDFNLFPEQFENLQLNNTYCLPSEGIEIEGYWNENTIKYVYINFNKCLNTSENNNSCKSEEVIDDFINDNKYINMYIRSPNVDNGNFESPFMPELQIYYQQLSSNLYKYIEFYLERTIISNDIGWFFQSLEKVHDVSVGKVYYDNAFYSNSSTYYSVSLYSGERETIISRKYQKIQDVLAQFGGMCNFLMIIGFFFGKIENGFHLRYLSMNKLYNFPKEGVENSQSSETKKHEKIRFLSKLDPIMKQRNEKNTVKTITMISDIMNSQRLEKEKENSKSADSNLRKYKYLKLKKHSLKYNFWEYLKLSIKRRKFNLSERDKFFIEGENKIQKEMDIINIVKRLQEVENLKKILLTQNQLYFFELLSKPTITLQSEKQITSKKELLRQSSLKINPSNKKENDSYKKFLALYKEFKSNKEKSMIDQNLLNLLDEDILQVLEV